MTSIVIKEKSLNLALIKASGKLGVSLSHLGYEILEEKKGLFGIFGRMTSIKAWARNSPNVLIKKSKRISVDNNKKSTRLRAPTKPLSSTDSKEIRKKIENTMQKICELMDCKQAKVSVREKDTRLIVDVADPFFAQEIKLKKIFVIMKDCE